MSPLPLRLFLLFFVLNASCRECFCAANIKNVRVLRQYASSARLECPLTSNLNEHIDLARIRWLNEKNDYFKPDQNVLVSVNNLIDRAKPNIMLGPLYGYVSCGYLLSNNQYVRLGFWKINYIDEAKVELQVQDNRPSSQYTSLNQTHGLLNICYTKPDWECVFDFLRFSCKNNFDLPTYTKYVWLYLYNAKTRQSEVWHRYDLDKAIDSYDNTYQTFYNSIKNTKIELSKFIRYISTESKNYELKIQCATYSENKNKNSCLYASSLNLTIINENCPGVTTIGGINLTALVGGILGALLALVLLLLLLCLLIYCCCCRRRRSETRTAKKSIHVNTIPVQTQPVVEKTEITNIAETSSFSTFQISPPPITVCNLNRVNSDYAACNLSHKCCCYYTTNNNRNNADNYEKCANITSRSFRAFPTLSRNRSCCCTEPQADLNLINPVACPSKLTNRDDFESRNLNTQITINHKRQNSTLNNDEQIYSSARRANKQQNRGGETYLNVLTIYPDPEEIHEEEEEEEEENNCQNYITTTNTNTISERNDSIYGHFEVPIEITNERQMHNSSNKVYVNKGFSYNESKHASDNQNSNYYHSSDDAYIQNRERIMRREIEESFDRKIRQENQAYNAASRSRYESYI